MKNLVLALCLLSIVGLQAQEEALLEDVPNENLQVTPVNPGLFGYAASRLIGSQWQNLTPAEKKKYKRWSAQASALVAEMMATVVDCYKNGIDTQVEGRPAKQCSMNTGPTVENMDNALLAGQLFDFFSNKKIKISNAFPAFITQSEMGIVEGGTIDSDSPKTHHDIVVESKQTWWDSLNPMKIFKGRKIDFNKKVVIETSLTEERFREPEPETKMMGQSKYIRAIRFLKNRRFAYGTNSYLRTYKISGFTCESTEECTVFLGASLPSQAPDVSPMEMELSDGYSQVPNTAIAPGSSNTGFQNHKAYRNPVTGQSVLGGYNAVAPVPTVPNGGSTGDYDHDSRIRDQERERLKMQYENSLRQRQ
jgi:hypothetical protein